MDMQTVRRLNKKAKRQDTRTKPRYNQADIRPKEKYVRRRWAGYTEDE